MPIKTAFYFGYVDGGGHFFQGRDSRRSCSEPQRIAPGFPWNVGLLDTGLLRNGKHKDVYDGKVFCTCGGTPLWLAFFWWDRSGDKRPNSNSGFYVQGFEHTERQAAFDYACSAFPQIVARQTVQLKLCE